MTGRAFAIAVALLMVGAAVPTAAFAQGPNPKSAFQMGYGPSALRPVTDGVPVYTTGDRMWVSSNYSTLSIVSLFSPASTSTPVATLLVEPGIPVPLHIFNQTDPEGTWSLEVQPTSGQHFTLPTQLIDIGKHLIRPRVISSNLAADTVQLTLAANLSQAYNIETCFSSNLPGSLAEIRLPPTIGTGLLSIGRNQTTLLISLAGNLTSAFTFWFEIYHPYSFSVPGTGELISRDLKSAESSPVLIQSAGNTSTSLQYDTSIRKGRAMIRAFFDNAQGLVVAQTSVLLLDDGSWFWLGACPLSQVSTETFTRGVDLTGSPTNWPRRLFLMYRLSGVESAVSIPILLNASKLVFVASPWGVPLNAGTLQPLYGGTNRFMQVNVVDRTIYVNTATFPAEIEYSISALGQEKSGLVSIAAPYTVDEVSVEVGKLTVRVVRDGFPVAGTSVQLSRAGANSNFSSTTDVNGIATFYVFGGQYTAHATIANQSQTQNLSIADGNQTNTTLSFTSNPVIPDSLQTALIIIGVAGIIGNIVVLALRGRLRGNKLPR